MGLKHKIPDSRLQAIVRRVLRINRTEIDIPVIVSTTEGTHCCSVGRLLERGGARVSALMDVALEGARPVTIFLPENAYVGEVTSCVGQGDQFAVELALIMSQRAEDGR
jgi:hypothetical protein